MKKVDKILFYLIWAVPSIAFNIQDYEFAQKSRNRIFSVFSDLKLSESEIIERVLGLIYEPFDMNVEEQADDLISAITKHLKINELRNQADPLTLEQMEQATVSAIEEEFNIETFESFKQAADLIGTEKRIQFSLAKISKMIIKTLRILVVNSFFRVQSENLSYWSLTLDSILLERLVNLTYEHIANIHTIVPINVRESCETLNELVNQDLKSFNNEFIYTIGELSHLIHDPGRFLRAEYEILFIKSIIENDWTSEGRLDLIIRLMENINQDSMDFDQLFAFLYNFKKSLDATDTETNKFVTKCIQLLFRNHYQSTNALAGLSHMRLFLINNTIVNNDSLFVEFIRLYHFNADQDGLLLKWMNLMLINQLTTLSPNEYNFLIENLGQYDRATPEMYYFLGFVNHLLTNSLIKLDKEQGFYFDFYRILLIFIVSFDQKADSGLGLAFNSVLDALVQKSGGQAISAVTYFVGKILNALSNRFQGTPFDISFLKRQTYAEDKQDIEYFISKCEEFEMLLRKVYQNLRPEEDSSKAPTEVVIETFYQASLSSKNFAFGKIESLDQVFALEETSMPSEHLYEISIHYTPKKLYEKNQSEFEVDESIEKEMDLHIDIKTLEQIKTESETEIHLENALLRLETPAERDNILRDVLSNVYEEDY